MAFPHTQGHRRGDSFQLPDAVCEHPDKWKKEQINKYSADGYVFPGLAGIGLPSEPLLAAYLKLPRAQSGWVQFVDILVRSQ